MSLCLFGNELSPESHKAAATQAIFCLRWWCNFCWKFLRHRCTVVATRATESAILSWKVELIQFLAIFFCDFLADTIAALARGWISLRTGDATNLEKIASLLQAKNRSCSHGLSHRKPTECRKSLITVWFYFQDFDVVIVTIWTLPESNDLLLQNWIMTHGLLPGPHLHRGGAYVIGSQLILYRPCWKRRVVSKLGLGTF